jgi:predicted RNase H-like HicB family nuclease
VKQVYPTFIAEYESDFLVYVPDMDIYTEGKSMVEAIEMARDAIGLKGRETGYKEGTLTDGYIFLIISTTAIMDLC